ncbi:Inosine triphosphate pyrophosphatase [Lachnellula occidentalis]|uniref:Inosine triphosphate pyrophosphatase n=1 Tax=Lachnellula occidentalis TaxID=215460 RepID=A0A8H8S8G8_9HELO|nr:Inosine triphosphate pyrophosphatase [Lachnellula occidentalis]
MAPPKQLFFITGNKNKLAESKAILGDVVDLQCQAIDLVEIQGTIEEISLDKCRRAADAVKGPVLVEDTCLCFNALGELPGPYIKWFLQAVGPQGLNNLLAGFPDKSAQAVCTFAYCEGPGHEPIIFQGRTDNLGQDSTTERPNEFRYGTSPESSITYSLLIGWDPIFEYEGQTYAEMEKVEKNKISHRFRALEKLKAWLQEA